MHGVIGQEYPSKANRATSTVSDEAFMKALRKLTSIDQATVAVYLIEAAAILRVSRPFRDWKLQAARA